MWWSPEFVFEHQEADLKTWYASIKYQFHWGNCRKTGGQWWIGYPIGHIFDDSSCLAMLDLQVHHLVGQWQGDGKDFTVQQAQQAASPCFPSWQNHQLRGMVWSPVWSGW